MTFTNTDGENLARLTKAMERIADAQERLLAIEASREVDRQDARAGRMPDRSPVLPGTHQPVGARS